MARRLPKLERVVDLRAMAGSTTDAGTEERQRSLRSKRGPVGRWASLAVVGVLALGLGGCATLSATKATSAPTHAPAAAHFNPSLLRVGMSIDEAQRLEPHPEKTITMTSQSMKIVEWVYEYRGGTAKLFFTNGLLESWST